MAPLNRAAKMSAEDLKWQAESDVRTLIDAEKIKSEPARLKRAMECAKEQQQALKKVGK